VTAGRPAETELEASAVIGAEPYERTASRTAHRNGHRSKLLDTGVGRPELLIQSP
jgi:putative transposase